MFVCSNPTRANFFLYGIEKPYSLIPFKWYDHPPKGLSDTILMNIFSKN